MTQTSTYTMESFVADLRGVFASTNDPIGRAEGVRKHVQQLLSTSGVLEEKMNLPAEGGFGRTDLYVDADYGHPSPGFLVMCSAQQPGQSNSPHDHGACWVVYGVYKGAIEQRKYNWKYPDGAPTTSSPTLQESERYTQKEGQAAYFLPGEIHTTHNVHDGRTIIVRVEAQDLKGVWRHRYNQETNTGSVYQSDS